MICDEIGFWEIENMRQSEYFNKVIVSRTNATKNWKNDHFTMVQIVCISNPNGQRGVMWDLWNDNAFHRYRYCFLANPENNIEEYNYWKKKMPADEFDSVYAATFTSASGGFITLEEYKDATKHEYECKPPLTQPIYFGGDFAGEDTVSRDVDSTVLIGTTHVKHDGEDKVQVCHTHEFPLRCKKQLVYDELARFPNIAKFAYDKPGVGDSVKNDLKDKGILPEFKIESLTYSLPNKSEVYYNMKRLFEQRLIMLPNITKLQEQLLGLRFEKTDAGHIKIHHKKEAMHDDWADALANACYAAKRLRGAIPSVTPLKRNPTSETKKQKLRTLVCPECEKEGKDGYYQGYNKSGKNLERTNCPIHTD